jgi:hypothetical protein
VTPSDILIKAAVTNPQASALVATVSTLAKP